MTTQTSYASIIFAPQPRLYLAPTRLPMPEGFTMPEPLSMPDRLTTPERLPMLPPSTSSGPPVTPKSKQRFPHLTQFNSTPGKPNGAAMANNSGVHDSLTNLTVPHVAPWIANDLENHKQCDIQKFLKYFLFQCRKNKDKDRDSQLTPEERNTIGQELLDDCLKEVLPLSNSKGLKERLGKYCSAKKEKAMYSPFVRTFNFALEELRKLDDKPDFRLRQESELRIMFHHNDPFLIYGHHFEMAWTHRKPDTVTVAFETAQKDIHASFKAGNWQKFAYDYAPEEPPKKKTTPPSKKECNSLNWAGCLCVEEFKFTGTPMKMPPTGDYDTTITTVAARPYRVTNEDIEVETADISAAEPATVPQDAPVAQDASVTAEMSTGESKEVKSPFAENSRKRPFLARNVKTAVSKTQAMESEPADKDKRRSGKRKAYVSLPGSLSKKSKSSTPMDAPGTGKRPSPPLQCALYGTEMLNSGLWATHAIALLIINDTLWLWWYDREGTIQSTGINFVQNLPYFLVLLAAFQRFDPEDWGTQRDLFSEGKSEFKLDVDGVTSFIDPNDEISSTFTLHGRGTQLTGARIMDRPNEKFVLKSSWPEMSRKNEAEIIKRAVEKGENDLYIKGHLPELVASSDLDYSTGSIREFLYHGETGRKIHPRVLRLSLFRRLKPIKSLEGQDFLNAWLECRRCHFRLWLHGIEHGDISMANLMVNPDTNAGILNDYDLAVIREGVRTPSGSERTGTIPFMAMELLCDEFFDGKILRQYRHDSESFIWVLVVKALTGHSKYGHWVDNLQTADHVRCLDKKRSFLLECDQSWALDSPVWLIACQLADWLETKESQRAKARKNALMRKPIHWDGDAAAEPVPVPMRMLEPDSEERTESEYRLQACEDFREFESLLKQEWLNYVSPAFELLPEWFTMYPPSVMPAPQS